MATFTISSDTLYSSLSIANDDNITITEGAVLTVDTSTVDIRQVQCTTFGRMSIENSSTTTPIFFNFGSTTTTNRRLRFEAGGEMFIRGDKIQIGTGTGIAGQVVTLPQDAGLNNCPDLGGLWVDHGDTMRDASSVLRPYVQVTDTLNAITTDKVSEIFTQDTGLNQVTFAKAVPLNAPIYMANVVVKLGDSLAVGDNPFTDFALSGTADFEWAHFGTGVDYNFSSGKSIRWINCTFYKPIDDLICTNQILGSELESVVIIGGNNTYAFTLANSPIFGSMKNCWIDMGRSDGNGYQVNAGITSEGYLEGNRFTCYNIGSFVTENQRGPIQLNNTSGFEIYDTVVASSQNAIFVTGGSSNIVIDNYKFQFGCRTTHVQTEALYCFRSASASNIILTRFHQEDPSVTGTIQPTSDAIYTGAGTVDCTFDDVILYAGAGTLGDSIDSIINETGLGCRYNNIFIYGQFDQRMIDFQTASINAEITNIRTDEIPLITNSSELGAGAKLDQIVTGRNNNTVSASAVGTGTDCISALYYDFDDTDKTQGRWMTRMSPSLNEVDYYTVNTQTGSIVFNNNNRLYMTTAGDEIELESRVHYNVVSAEGYGVSGISVGSGWTILFALRRPDGVYTAFRTPDSTNFNLSVSELDADTDNRLQIRWRLTRDASNAVDYIGYLYFNVTLSGDDYPFSIGKADLTLTGLQPNSEVRVYDGATEIMGIEDSGTTFTGEYSVPYSAGEFTSINATIVIHSLGYVPVRLENVILGPSGSDIPIQQRIDRNYANP